MADQMQPAAPRGVGLRPAEVDRTRFQRDQACDRAQQAGLSNAIGTSQRTGLAGLKRQVEAREQASAAAANRNIPQLKSVDHGRASNGVIAPIGRTWTRKTLGSM